MNPGTPIIYFYNLAALEMSITLPCHVTLPTRLNNLASCLFLLMPSLHTASYSWTVRASLSVLTISHGIAYTSVQCPFGMVHIHKPFLEAENPKPDTHDSSQTS